MTESHETSVNTPGRPAPDLTWAAVLLPRTAGQLPVPHHDPAQVRGAARAILKRPEFHPPKRSWWSAAIAWVFRELGKLLSKLLGLGGGSGAGAWIPVVVIAAVLVVIGVLVVRYSVRMPRDPSRPVVVTVSTAGRSAVDWRAEAARHEREGRWRDALRCRYRALVADLARRGVVEEVPGRTAGEYRAAVAASVPYAGADFTGATELFENAWYGDRPTGPDNQTEFDVLADRVLTSVGAPR